MINSCIFYELNRINFATLVAFEPLLCELNCILIMSNSFILIKKEKEKTPLNACLQTLSLEFTYMLFGSSAYQGKQVG